MKLVTEKLHSSRQQKTICQKSDDLYSVYIVPIVTGSVTGMRHVQALMATASIVIIYIFRVNMSVAIVAMTTKKNANPDFPVNITSARIISHLQLDYSLFLVLQQYKWNEAEKGMVLSSFFWGYLLLQILMGKLAEKYGAKIILAVGMTAASLLNIGIPFAAPYGYVPVLILRVLQGAVQVWITENTSRFRLYPLSAKSNWFLVFMLYRERSFLAIRFYCQSGSRPSNVPGH